MLTISVPDSLRMSVEAASGGRQTVLYTAKGQPTYMNIISQVDGPSLDATLPAGPHPAFVVGGVVKSSIMIGTYPGVIRNGELLSLPGVDPTASQNHDTFVNTARANGIGHHVCTNAEYALLALLCRANSFQPRGNTNWGRSSDATWETGRRNDGVAPGTASGTGRTLTGSGPVSWRHDNTFSGISDLSGNVWGWSPGMRIVDGEIQILEGNNAALNTTDMSAGSAAWRAIDGSNGNLVNPGSANTVKYATSGTAAYTLVCASGSSFELMTNPGTTPVGAAALALLRAYGLFPVASQLGGTIAAPAANGDGFYITLTGERVPIRGGDWYHSAIAGVFALALNNARSDSNTIFGARPAFVL